MCISFGDKDNCSVCNVVEIHQFFSAVKIVGFVCTRLETSKMQFHPSSLVYLISI
jgi:hypothetical protein